MPKILIFLLAGFLSFGFAYSQNVNQDRAKLAENFEKSGDYTNSIRIYRELYKISPNNETYFQGLARGLYNTNQFAELAPIIEEKLKNQKNAEIYSLYAEVLWKLGKTENANEAWNLAINCSPKDAKTYTYVSNSQTKLLLFEKSVNTLEKARKEFGNQGLYADEMSRLYIAAGMPVKASDEIIAYYMQTRNLNQSQGRISSILHSKDAAANLSKKLAKLAEEEPVNNRMLYAWYLMAIGDRKNSLTQYQIIDNKMNSKGLEIFNFANSCVKDNYIDDALKAFGLLIDMGKNTPYLINALFGYTRALEARNQDAGIQDSAETIKIIQRYENIAAIYPNNNVSFDASYRAAILYKDALKNNDKAKQALTKLSQDAKNQPISLKALNALGDVFFSENNLSKAQEIFKSVSISNAQNIQAEKDYADYKIAEMVYFAGDIDSAEVLFNNITSNSESNQANDALEKSFIISQFKNLNKAIRDFAKAEMLDKQNKDEQAIQLYNEVATQTEGEGLSELSKMKIAGIYKSNRKYQEMRLAMKRIIDENPESIYADKIYLELGDSFLTEKNYSEALKYYTELLAKFPQSIYLETAREQIRIIRANSNG
jgi:tetratricopeptide (TPR) repeat protein